LNNNENNKCDSNSNLLSNYVNWEENLNILKNSYDFGYMESQEDYFENIFPIPSLGNIFTDFNSINIIKKEEDDYEVITRRDNLIEIIINFASDHFILEFNKTNDSYGLIKVKVKAKGNKNIIKLDDNEKKEEDIIEKDDKDIIEENDKDIIMEVDDREKDNKKEEKSQNNKGEKNSNNEKKSNEGKIMLGITIAIYNKEDKKDNEDNENKEKKIKYLSFMDSTWENIIKKAKYKHINSENLIENEKAKKLIRNKKIYEYLRELLSNKKIKEEFFKSKKAYYENFCLDDKCKNVANKIFERKNLDGLLILLKYGKPRGKSIEYNDKKSFAEEIKKLKGFEKFSLDLNDMDNRIVESRLKKLEDIANEIIKTLTEKNKQFYLFNFV